MAAETNSPTLTCVIPTHQRSHFLRRLARHLSRTAGNVKFLIADSSSASHRQANRAIVDNLRGNLDIQYHHFESDFITKVHEALRLVTAPYVTLCADDDYANFDVSQKCVEYLANHPDYSCAMGQVLVSWSDGRSPSLTNARSVVDSSPLDRFQSVGDEPFSNFYGVYRTELLTRNFGYTREHLDYKQAWVFSEEMLIQLTMLAGKQHFINEPHYLFGVHDSNTSAVVERITDPTQSMRLYAEFREAMIIAITDADSSILQSQAERCLNRYYGFVGRNGKRTVAEKVSREFRKTKQLLMQALGIFRKRQAVLSGLEAAEGYRDLPAMAMAWDDMILNPNGCAISDAMPRSRSEYRHAS